jgi:hypothetical protein
MAAANRPRWNQVIPLIVYLDELGTYNIPGIQDFVATARSGGAGVVAALQNQDQLKQFYGHESVTHMLTNFRTNVYLRGCHSKVAQELSERTGTRLVRDELKTKSQSATAFRIWPNFSKGEQLRPVEVPVLTPDEIEFLPETQAIVVGPTKPALVELVRHYEDGQIAKWVEASQTQVARRTKQNRAFDQSNQDRPQGEPRRLPQYTYDWNLIPGVMEAIRREEGATDPMVNAQERQIHAKLRDLGLTGDREAIVKTVCHKPWSQLTKADARRLIQHLESLESQARRAGVGGSVV